MTANCCGSRWKSTSSARERACPRAGHPPDRAERRPRVAERRARSRLQRTLSDKRAQSNFRADFELEQGVCIAQRLLDFRWRRSPPKDETEIAGTFGERHD